MFNSTPLERKLAVLLGIPLNGLDPKLQYLGTKSGSRKIFREAGVDIAMGVEDVKTEADVVDALRKLRRCRPSARRAVIKLNESFSGEGNALCAIPDAGNESADQALASLDFGVPTETRESYFEKLSAMGGVVEEFLEGRQKASPSAQLRTSPDGSVLLISTHDQILGGPSGQVYMGCTFPAHDGYRLQVQDLGLRIGRVLADHGVVSRFGVDFLAARDTRRKPWRLTALEINLRVVGTTHPFLALRFLTGGELNPATGLFYSLSRRVKDDKATDNLQSEAYRGLLPEDLFDILTVNQLHYDQRTESGVLFHLIGAVSEFGKLGRDRDRQQPHRSTGALRTHAHCARRRNAVRMRALFTRLYSECRTLDGSTRDARHAGIVVANTVMVTTSTMAAVRMSGSDARIADRVRPAQAEREISEESRPRAIQNPDQGRREVVVENYKDVRKVQDAFKKKG